MNYCLQNEWGEKPDPCFFRSRPPLPLSLSHSIFNSKNVFNSCSKFINTECHGTCPWTERRKAKKKNRQRFYLFFSFSVASAFWCCRTRFSVFGIIYCLICLCNAFQSFMDKCSPYRFRTGSCLRFRLTQFVFNFCWPFFVALACSVCTRRYIWSIIRYNLQDFFFRADRSRTYVVAPHTLHITTEMHLLK